MEKNIIAKIRDGLDRSLCSRLNFKKKYEIKLKLLFSF